MRFTNQTHWPTTHEWGIRSNLLPELELIKMSLCSFVSNAYYESQEDFIKRFREVVEKTDDSFSLKLAVWARENWLRTINQMILVEKLRSQLFNRAFNKLVQRPDELLDIVGYYAMINWQNLEDLKLANKFKKAIKEKLESFNEYKLAKYKWKKGKVNLYDLVNLTHPKSGAIDKLAKGELWSAETREKNVSEKGNNRKVRMSQLQEKNLWNLAFVRNIRNMLKAWIKEQELLEYAKELKFHNVFPFQLINALSIAVTNWLQQWWWLFLLLESKIKESLQKFTWMFEWKTAIWIDVSWSMFCSLSDKSSIYLIDMALYYWMYLSEICNADVYLWSNDCIKVDKDTTIKTVRKTAYAIRWWTYLWSFTNMVSWKYDNYFVITDEQVHDSSIRDTWWTKIIWNIWNYRWTITKIYWWDYITWLDDRLLWLVKDLNNIENIKKEILAIEV